MDEFIFPPATADRLRVHEAIALFWRYHFQFTRGAKKYMARIRAINQDFGNKFMDEVSGYDVKRHKEGIAQSGLGLGVQFHAQTLIHLLFSKFNEWKITKFRVDGYEFSQVKLPEYNPTTGIRKVMPQPRMVYITPDEYARLMEHATDRLKDYIRFELHSCLRPGEAFVLKTSHWNTALQRLVFTQPKTGRLKSLPVTPQQKEIIERAIKDGRQFILDKTNHENEWKACKKAARLPHIQRRDLRRTSYTETVKALGHAAYGQIMAGHASMRTGEERYLALHAINVQPAVDHLSKIFA
jgi:hypothetical protein